MVFGQLLDLPLAQQIGARIAHMRQRIALAAQHQRRERGQPIGRLAPPIDAVEPGILRADDAVQRHRRLPGGGRAEEVIGQTRHRGLRGFAPPAAGAHAIGHGGQHAGAVARHLHRGKVFVHRRASGARDPSNVEFKRHGVIVTTKPRGGMGPKRCVVRVACTALMHAGACSCALRLSRWQAVHPSTSSGRTESRQRLPLLLPVRGEPAASKDERPAL